MTWHGMPAYAKDGKVVCFFQVPSPQKFNTRHAALGFTDATSLDEGAMWPIDFALKQLEVAEAAQIAVLERRAVSGRLGVPWRTAPARR